MKNITGPPVQGENFFGREDEFDYVWKRIEDGNNVIFPSPRRVGKTSFALKLVDKAKKEGWNIISINLEKVSTEHDFIEMFIDKLKEQSWWESAKEKGSAFIEFFKQLKPSVSYGGASLELDWKSSKENIYKKLSELLNHDEKTLIFLDELTVLLTSIIKSGEGGEKDVKDFLHWLRDIRITPDSNIRWIYCSSVGIENFTHKYGISDTINDVTDYNLKSYSREQSIAMLKQLGETNDLKLSDEILKSIVTYLDYCLPFFLQIIFEKINYLSKIENITLNNDIVDIAYKSLIEEKHFNTWVERIIEQYGDNKDYAFLILKHICQEKKGSRRGLLIDILASAGLNNNKAEDITALLIYMLKNDGYLIEESNLYRFRSPLLRDFWFNRFIK